MVTVSFPDKAPANTAPADSPSGILCNVTASTSIVVFFKLHFGPSVFLTVQMKMRHCAVHKKQKSNSNQKSNCRRNKSQPSHPSIHFHCRNQKGPYRSRHHHARRKTKKPFLHQRIQFLFIKNTQAAPRVCPKKGIISPQNTFIRTKLLYILQ